MTTMKDVAEKAGVSKATVSHVINKTRYVSPELTKKVKVAMEELGYKPNAVARSLTTQRTQTIGLMVSDISNPFFSTLVRGVEDAAVENDYSLIVCNTDETLEKEKLYINVLIQKKMDGLIIAPTGKSDEELKLLRKRDIPFVFVDRIVEGIEADAVLAENIEGVYRATKHLIEQGHKVIGLIIGLRSVSTTQERLEGYKKALKEFNIAFNRKLVVVGGSQVQGGTEAVEKLMSLDEPPSAIFSANNLMTLGALIGIKKAGLNCPEDISLACFDDPKWAHAFDLTLTAVRQDPYLMGAKAAEMLFDRLKDKNDVYKKVRISTELIVRSSSKKLQFQT